MVRFVLPFLAAAIVLAAAAPAEAQSRRDLTLRIDALQARLNDLEAGGSPAEDMLMRVEALEREQRVLTGEIERLGYENRQLRNQLQTAMEAIQVGARRAPATDTGPSGEDLAIVDPDNPFADTYRSETRALGSPGSAQDSGDFSDDEDRALNGGAASGGRAAPSMDSEELFREGRRLLLDGDFGGAQDAFADFTDFHPDDALAGQAWYWLGETHFVQGDFADASDAYLASLRAERRGERAPDALVRLGASLAALGSTQDACDVLSTFNSEFPNADAEARRRAEREATRAGC